MTGNISKAVAAIAPLAQAAESAATPVAAAAAKATASGSAGLLGYAAGAAGLAVTLFNTFKDTIIDKRGIGDSAIAGNAMLALGGGAGLLALSGTGKIGGVALGNGLRGAGLALIAGGVIGAVAGAVQRFGNHGPAREAADSRLQRPKTFTTDLPAAPSSLEGMSVAWGEAITKDRKLLDLGIYVDPNTAKQLPAGTTLGEAIGQAHARSQEDDADRSHAVIQTKDGALWTMRLSGDLDQIDGRNFTKDNSFDPYQQPLVGKQQAALQAIAGVESVYVFPKGMGAAEAPQDPGTVPWVTPKLPTPATPTTPATSAPSVTSPPATTTTNGGTR